MLRLLLLFACAFSLLLTSYAEYSQPLYHIFKNPKKKANVTKAAPKKPYIPVAIMPTPKQTSPFILNCQVAATGPRTHIVNCNVYSNANYPMCIHLRCLPAPKGACVSGAKAKDCAWNVVNGCSSPTPLYPGGSWSFGFMTSTAAPIKITAPTLGPVVTDPFNGVACPH